jgi:dipeptidyl aminopeptidase/acylaminoacyl peptidase
VVHRVRRFRTFGLLFASLSVAAAATTAQHALPPGAVAIINQDRFGSQVAICVGTRDRAVQRGPRKISPTEVWAGEANQLHKLNAGVGACDPAWSPDGRRIAVTAADGLWVFPAASSNGRLSVEARVPLGEPVEFTYRAFSHPEWSPDGDLVALLVTNGGNSWVEVFDPASGRLFYTSPPAAYAFSWGSTSRSLKVGDLNVNLPSRR